MTEEPKTRKLKKPIIVLFLAILLLCSLCFVLSIFAYVTAPPSFELDKPKENTTVTNNSSIDIQFRCIKINSVKLNNKEVKMSDICFGKYNVTLNEGENKFIATAVDEKNTSHKLEFTIKFEPKQMQQPTQIEVTPTSVTTVSPQPSTSGEELPPKQTEIPIDRGTEKRLIESKLKSSDGFSQIDSVNINENIDGTYHVSVIFDLICMSENGCIENARITSGEYYYTLFKNNALKVNEAVIGARLGVMDKYGNEKNIIVYQTKLTSEIAKKINWNQDEATVQVNLIPGLWELQKNSIASYY